MSSLILIVIVGTAAGFIATRMFNLNLGIPQTIAIGVLGALIGGFVLRLLLAALGIFAGLLGAIFGAAILIVLYQKYVENKK